VRTVIVGCGRVGAGLAERLAQAGHDVTVLDVSTEAFNRLPSNFGGTAIRGDGTDEDVLRRAGAEGADWFYALTNGDNRNILSAQLANENLGIPKVVAKINDPLRAQAYATLGIATICRTTLLVDALAEFGGQPVEGGHGVAAATGDAHHGDEHGVSRRMQVASEPFAAEAPEHSAGGNGQRAAGPPLATEPGRSES